MARWEQYANLVDTSVDDFFGERVLLLPYIKHSIKAATPDGSRVATEIVAVEMTFKSTPTQVASSISKTVEADLSLSVQQHYVDAVPLRQFDRVQMLERGDVVYEISLIEPSDTARPVLKLLRIAEP